MNKDYCIQYFKRYPHSKIQDFIKFLYQSILGSGHLISDVDKNYKMLLDEYDSIEYDKSHILFEEISDDLVRIHLESLKREYLKDIHHLLMLSVETASSKEILLEAFKQVEKGIEEGWIPFDRDEWREEIERYVRDGCPVISHSETFRKLYHPHYRLVKREYLKRISSLLG